MATLSESSILKISGIFIIGFLLASLSLTASAGKIYRGYCAHIYMCSGELITADGKQRIRMPKKNEKLEIISEAYTNKNIILRKIDPETVDSVVVWSVTSPERTHTLRFVDKYGWCYQLERNPFLTVYSFATKGYSCAGNGGLWLLGKSSVLVDKAGKIYNFGKPDKQVNKQIINRLESLASDDPAYLLFLKTAKGRCDKVVRSLVMYNP